VCFFDVFVSSPKYFGLQISKQVLICGVIGAWEAIWSSVFASAVTLNKECSLRNLITLVDNSVANVITNVHSIVLP